MAKGSPAGYLVRVQVHLIGEIIEPTLVQSHPPYLFFEVAEEPRSRVVAVRPEHIARVEIKFVRADGKQPPGFSVQAPDEELGAFEEAEPT